MTFRVDVREHDQSIVAQEWPATMAWPTLADWDPSSVHRRALGYEGPVKRTVEVWRFDSALGAECHPGEGPQGGEAVVEIDARQRAQLLGEVYRGDHFVFLMTNPIKCKINSFVGFTRQPLVEVFLHNRRLSRERNTCMAAGHWQLNSVLGPFPFKALAIDAGHALVAGSRGKSKREEKAALLAVDYAVGFYNYRAKPRRSLEEIVADHAPPGFARLLRELQL